MHLLSPTRVTKARRQGTSQVWRPRRHTIRRAQLEERDQAPVATTAEKDPTAEAGHDCTTWPGARWRQSRRANRTRSRCQQATGHMRTAPKRPGTIAAREWPLLRTWIPSGQCPRRQTRLSAEELTCALPARHLPAQNVGFVKPRRQPYGIEDPSPANKDVVAFKEPVHLEMPSLEEQQLAARQLAHAVWHTVNHVEHGTQRHRIQQPSPIVFELQKFDLPSSQSSTRTLQNESVGSFYVDLGKGNLTRLALAEEVVQSRHRRAPADHRKPDAESWSLSPRSWRRRKHNRSRRRGLCQGLRPVALERTGLPASIWWSCRARRRSGVMIYPKLKRRAERRQSTSLCWRRCPGRLSRAERAVAFDPPASTRRW